MTRTHQPETTPPTHNGTTPTKPAGSPSSRTRLRASSSSCDAKTASRHGSSPTSTTAHAGSADRTRPPYGLKPPLPFRPHCCKRRRTTTTGCTPWSRPAAWRKPPWATSQKCCGSSKNASSSQGNDSPAHGPTSPCTTTRRRHASCNDSNGHSAPMKKPSRPSMAPPQSSNDGCARTPSAGPTTLTGPSCSSS